SVDRLSETAHVRQLEGLERFHLESAQVETLPQQPHQHRVRVLLECLPQLFVGEELADQDLHALLRHDTLVDAGNLSTIASTVFLSSCSYCASSSETAATPWPRHSRSLVLGSNTSTFTGIGSLVEEVAPASFGWGVCWTRNVRRPCRLASGLSAVRTLTPSAQAPSASSVAPISNCLVRIVFSYGV